LARIYSKNLSNYTALGVGALGPRLNGAKQISLATWYFPTTIGNGDTILENYINSTNEGIRLFVGASAHLNIRSRSVTTDGVNSSAGTATLTTGSWWLVGVVIDYVAKTEQLWVNGVTDGSPFSATYGNGSYTYGAPTDTDGIGAQFGAAAPGSTAAQVAGSLADFGIWTTALRAADWNALWRGIAPGNIWPNSLVGWWPLDDTGNSIRDRGWFGRKALVTGSIPVGPDPPRPGRLLVPRRRKRFGVAAAVTFQPWIYGDQIEANGVM
jgi:hypothetical protein